jgi:hypothetical protein
MSLGVDEVGVSRYVWVQGQVRRQFWREKRLP